MVRAPCYEKIGLKKGPWTPEEGQILVNWRALPKQAALVVIIFLFLMLTTKPLEAARSLANMKPTFGGNKVSFPEDRGPLPVPPSAPNPRTYIPNPSGNGLCNK